ncbi:MAG: asparagine synthase-related protein, partial [Candidatus Eiseniibacteriota bacterium]
MTTLLGALAWHDDPSGAVDGGGHPVATAGPGVGQAAADLDRLLAHRPAAPWHEVERRDGVAGSVAVVSPASAAGWRPAAVGGAPHELVAVVAGGNAAPGVARLAATADVAELTRRRLLPVTYAGARLRGDRLELVADRLGSHPLYVRRRPYGLVFGTSALLLALLEPRSRLDPLTVAALLCFGQPLGRRTLFEDVEALPAGAVGTWTARGSTQHAPDWPPLEAACGHLADRARALGAALEAAVTAGHHAGQAGLLLSGGLDSRLLLALLAPVQGPLAAYTFGADGCLDIQLARRVTAHVEVTHRVRPTTAEALGRTLRHGVALTDGTVSTLHFVGLEVLPGMRDEVDAQWNGFAGDAILGGAFAHPRYLRPGPPAVGERLFRVLAHILSPGALPGLLVPTASASPGAALRQEFADAVAAAGNGERPEVAFRVLMRERVGRLAASGLALDRHYLPVITPYANGPVIARMLRMARSDRRFSRLLRATLGITAPELARIPWQRTGAAPSTPWPWQVVRRGWRRLAARWSGGAGPAMIDPGPWLAGPLAARRRRWIECLAEQPLFRGERLRELARRPGSAPPELDGILMSLG